MQLHRSQLGPQQVQRRSSGQVCRTRSTNRAAGVTSSRRCTTRVVCKASTSSKQRKGKVGFKWNPAQSRWERDDRCVCALWWPKTARRRRHPHVRTHSHTGLQPSPTPATTRVGTHHRFAGLAADESKTLIQPKTGPAYQAWPVVHTTLSDAGLKSVDVQEVRRGAARHKAARVLHVCVCVHACSAGPCGCGWLLFVGQDHTMSLAVRTPSAHTTKHPHPHALVDARRRVSCSSRAGRWWTCGWRPTLSGCRHRAPSTCPCTGVL
jgi:hypothetical protein